MNDTYRRADIFVQNHFAGILSETDEGYYFEYSEEYLQSSEALSVSLSLPLREEPYHSPTMFPFFDGIIPEGWLLDMASRNWKIDRNDRFGLLLLCCTDCIGDVSVREAANEM